MIRSSSVPNQRRDPFTFFDGCLFGIVLIVRSILVPPLFSLLLFCCGGGDGKSDDVVGDGNHETAQTTTINGRTGRATQSNMKTIVEDIPVLSAVEEGGVSSSEPTRRLIGHNGTCIVFHEIVQIFTLRIQLCLELLRVIPTLCQ